jgi:hypothetical protein
MHFTGRLVVLVVRVVGLLLGSLFRKTDERERDQEKIKKNMRPVDKYKKKK